MAVGLSLCFDGANIKLWFSSRSYGEGAFGKETESPITGVIRTPIPQKRKDNHQARRVGAFEPVSRLALQG